MLDFVKILMLTQEELATHVEGVAKEKGFNVISKHPYYIGINIKDNQPCLVAHLDKVGEIPKPDQVKFDYPLIRSKDTPIGGDDRCGVWIMLELIRNCYYQYSYLFCFDEEKGCIGSSKVDVKFKPTCLIGLDRRGFNDCALYGYDNDELISVFETQGYKPTLGSITDVAILAERYKIACINLSVGFFNEHTKDEFININAMRNTLEIISKPEIISKLSMKEYKYKEFALDDTFLYDIMCEYCGQKIASRIDHHGLAICEDCDLIINDKYYTS